MTPLNYVEVMMRIEQLGGPECCMVKMHTGDWIQIDHLNMSGTAAQLAESVAREAAVLDVAGSTAHACCCNGCMFVRQAAATAARIKEQRVWDQIIKESKK